MSPDVLKFKKKHAVSISYISCCSKLARIILFFLPFLFALDPIDFHCTLSEKKGTQAVTGLVSFQEVHL